ncbi:hypothetical protein V1478_008465 [Vespula squamosa]|uniref:Uncharacterized protein n=1 Tax=Vespula squamosa TaxID=30214 RepID=A0ABD2AUF1_VESSQ
MIYSSYSLRINSKNTISLASKERRKKYTTTTTTTTYRFLDIAIGSRSCTILYRSFENLTIITSADQTRYILSFRENRIGAYKSRSVSRSLWAGR